MECRLWKVLFPVGHLAAIFVLENIQILNPNISIKKRVSMCCLKKHFNISLISIYCFWTLNSEPLLTIILTVHINQSFCTKIFVTDILVTSKLRELSMCTVYKIIYNIVWLFLQSGCCKIGFVV